MRRCRRSRCSSTCRRRRSCCRRRRHGARAHLHADLRDAVRGPPDARHRACRARRSWARRRPRHARDEGRRHPGRRRTATCGRCRRTRRSIAPPAATPEDSRRCSGSTAPTSRGTPLWVDTGRRAARHPARRAFGAVRRAAPARRARCTRMGATARARWPTSSPARATACWRASSSRSTAAIDRGPGHRLGLRQPRRLAARDRRAACRSSWPSTRGEAVGRPCRLGLEVTADKRDPRLGSRDRDRAGHARVLGLSSARSPRHARAVTPGNRRLRRAPEAGTMPWSGARQQPRGNPLGPTVEDTCPGIGERPEPHDRCTWCRASDARAVLASRTPARRSATTARVTCSRAPVSDATAAADPRVRAARPRRRRRTRPRHGHTTTASPPPPARARPTLADPRRRARARATTERKAFVQQQIREGLALRGWWLGEMLATDVAAHRAHDAVLAQPLRLEPAEGAGRAPDVPAERHCCARTRSAISARCCTPRRRTRRCSSTSTACSNRARRAERELRARGDGAVHAGRRPLHRARRQGSGARVHRLEPRSRHRRRSCSAARCTTRARRRCSAAPGASTATTVLDLLLARPETAEFVVAKLWREFVSPDPDAAEVARIAAEFRALRLPHPGRAARLLATDAFWATRATAARWSRARSSWSSARCARSSVAPDDASPFAFAAAGIGQNLFSPPNVKGWPRRRRVDRLLDAARAQAVRRALARYEESRPGMRPPRWPAPTRWARGRRSAARSAAVRSRRPRRRRTRAADAHRACARPGVPRALVLRDALARLAAGRHARREAPQRAVDPASAPAGRKRCHGRRRRRPARVRARHAARPGLPAQVRTAMQASRSRQGRRGGAGRSARSGDRRASRSRRLRTGAAYRNLLVLVELKGGNDGLNTVVPIDDPAYARLRPRLAIARDQAVRLSDRAALHPSLAPLVPLWERRELAILQGVGYPEPNLSHFRSIEIWETASRSDQYARRGLARPRVRAPAGAGELRRGRRRDRRQRPRSARRAAARARSRSPIPSSSCAARSSPRRRASDAMPRSRTS